jgi:sortase (surface protein transpeptidase)
MFVVHPVKDFSIVVSSPEKPEDAILTMFACHPLYSDAKRFVVRARLVREGQ